jgi:hypothetical protein
MLNLLFLFGGLGVLAVVLSLALPRTVESNNVLMLFSLVSIDDFQANQS